MSVSLILLSVTVLKGNISHSEREIVFSWNLWNNTGMSPAVSGDGGLTGESPHFGIMSLIFLRNVFLSYYTSGN